MTKPLPKHYIFFVFYCCCALKYHAAANFLIGGRESLKMVVVFGECGRECLSGPGNTVIILMITVQRVDMTGPATGSSRIADLYNDAQSTYCSIRES